MSRGNTMNLQVQVSIEEADQALEALYRKWQTRFNITPNIGEAAGQGAGGTPTFGGLAGGGNPGAWRSQDPAVGQRLREPQIFGQGLSSLPAHVQAAIAANDPVSAAYLAQGPEPTAADRAAYRARIAAENRQHRDESYVDRRDFGDYKRDFRAGEAAQNRQERDETFADKQRIQADRAVARAQRTSEERQYRDESYIDRRAAVTDRASFRADLAGMSPRQQSQAITDRMTGLDEDSSEYQQLRAQQARLQPQLGLNRTIAPNHMYMQAMFGLMDVAGTVSHISRENSLAQSSGSVQEALQHQVNAVTGGGGIISQILKGGWDILGEVIPGLDSPAKVEASNYLEARRADNMARIKSGQVSIEVAGKLREAHQGTFSGRWNAASAKAEVAYAGLDKQIQELTALNSIPISDMGIVESRKSLMRSLVSQKGDVDTQRGYDWEQILFDRTSYLNTSKSSTDTFSLVGSGASSTAVARKEMSDRHDAEMRAAKREQDPDIVNATTRRHLVESDAFEFTRYNQDRAAQETVRGAISASTYQAQRDPFAASIATATAQGNAAILAADGSIMRALAQTLKWTTIAGIGADFNHQVGMMNAASSGASAVFDALSVGDTYGAQKLTINNRMNRELEQIPQGAFRQSTEAAIRKRYGDELAFADQREDTARVMEKQRLNAERNLATYDANGLDKSVQAQSILEKANLGIQHYGRPEVNRPDLQRIVAETGLEQAKAYKRQLQISQYTEGSAEEAAPGTFGPGGSSTVPKELEKEQIGPALIKVENVIDELTSFLKSLTGDD